MPSIDLQIAVVILSYLAGAATVLVVMSIIQGREIKKHQPQRMPKRMKEFFQHSKK